MNPSFVSKQEAMSWAETGTPRQLQGAAPSPPCVAWLKCAWAQWALYSTIQVWTVITAQSKALWFLSTVLLFFTEQKAPRPLTVPAASLHLIWRPSENVAIRTAADSIYHYTNTNMWADSPYRKHRSRFVSPLCATWVIRSMDVPRRGSGEAILAG